ncbi:M81 family metallopeptidase [Phycicoccus ginsengisoli]
MPSPPKPCRPLRIAVAGMWIESSTFSPHRAQARDFHVLDGPALLARHGIRAVEADGIRWHGIHFARSLPGGAVQPDVYEHHLERIRAGLRELADDGGLDGVLLDIHGAMGVVGLDDAEAHLVRAVRDVVGPGVVFAAAMDLHGNVSRDLAEQVDLLTCFRTAPHEDADQTRARAAATLVEVLRSGRRPVRAWVPVPVLLPGERTSTRVEPARSLYAAVAGVAARDGVLDASVWVGYAWADEPRCHAAVVVQGWDEGACAQGARELAEALWAARDDFGFVGPTGTLDEAVDAALASTARPYVISDSGDNPGAGGTGDVTWALTRLLRRPELTRPGAPTTLVASVFDAGALAHLRSCPVGAEVRVEVGARTVPSPAPPVDLRGVLLSVHEGDAQTGGVAVVRVGGLHVVVTEFRAAFHDVADFTAIGLDPFAADLVVTKIGYLEPTLHDLAAGWTLALTPGGVDQDLARLGHHRIRRPMHPFDDETHVGSGWKPDLTPVLLAGPAGPVRA